MDTGVKRIKVLVVDDRPVVVEGVISLLAIEPSILVVGNAKKGGMFGVSR
jgi:YesN/AraC family two-component response regulator